MRPYAGDAEQRNTRTRHVGDTMAGWNFAELWERIAAKQPDADAQVAASVLTAFVAGRLQRFARSGFRRAPSEQLDACLARML